MNFADNGWLEITDDDTYTLTFNQFAAARNFSLQLPALIDAGSNAVAFDFSDIDSSYPIPNDRQLEIECKLRRLLLNAFTTCSPDRVCYAIDVNHSVYRFLPVHIKSIEFHTWPIPVVPWAEYVNFSTFDFEQGLFLNPKLGTLVAYGGSFAEMFAEQFTKRQTDVAAALT